MTLIPKQSNKNFVKPLELKISLHLSHTFIVCTQTQWIVNLRQNYIFILKIIQDTAYRNNYYFSLGTVVMVFIQVFFSHSNINSI